MERSPKPYLLRSLAVTLLAWAATACDEIATTRVLPQVWEIKGDAFVLEGESRRTLTATTTIGVGDVVETAENASAIIALMPGMVLQMNADTSIRIDSLRLVKNGNATAFAMRRRQARVELSRGSVQIAMAIAIARGELEMVTPAGTLTAPEASTFYVACLNQRVRVVAASGELNFRSKAGAGAVIVPTGHYMDWHTETGNAVAEPQTLESEDKASEQAKAAFEAERRVAELTPQMRDRRPPHALLLKER